MVDPSDGDLVRRAHEGDVSAVGQLYDRHHERIFRYVWSRVSDSHLAEDLTGEVFTRMVISLPEYRPTAVPFRAWLYRIAHNLVVDHYRKESRHASIPLHHAESQSGEAENPASIVERQITVERVHRALDRLHPSQREVVVLRFLVGLSLREVALTLGRSIAAIKSLQHRGLAALRAALKQV